MAWQRAESGSWEGRLIAGRYEVSEVIGRGAMGEVRAGRDRRLDRAVAVKILRADLADQTIRRRFEDEARLAARLLHPNVVTVFDSGEEEGVPYVIMERLSGRTLADDIAAGPLDIDVVRLVGTQILDALSAAHTAGVVHRDVKPSNVLVAAPGCWKVGDFGIAKILELSDHELTVAGVVIGTPAYLAPERLAGGPATIATDLYAVGVVLYEALCGRRPVDEGAPLAALLTATPPPVTDRRPETPPSLEAAVMRAMSRDPGDRFPTAAAMAQAVTGPVWAPSIDDTIGVPVAVPTTVTQVLTAHQPAPSEPAGSGARRVGAFRRRPALAVAAAGAGVLVAVLAVGLAGRRGTTVTPTAPTVTAAPAALPGSLPGPLDAALARLEQAIRP